MKLVRTSAEAWRTGAASLLGLVTTGLLIKGPNDFTRLSTDVRVVLTVLLGGGLVFAIAGLWQLLIASAGVPRTTTLVEVRAKYGSLRAAEVVWADQAARAVRIGRTFVLMALLVVIFGVGVWWWAATPPKAQLEVTVKGKNLCGSLVSGDEQRIVLQITGERSPRDIPITSIENLHPVTTCK